MSSGIFVGLSTAITDGFNEVLAGETLKYSTMVQALAVGSITLYVLWLGYKTLAGKQSAPIESLVWDMAVFAIILAFATNADGYLDMTKAAVNDLKNGFSGGGNVWELLDTIWDKAQLMGSMLDSTDYFSITGSLAAYTVWIGVAALLIVSAVVSLTAELTLMLMLTTAPIFIFCLMFGWLRSMFNNWAQTIFGALLTILFASLALRVVINYFTKVLDKSGDLVASGDVNGMTVAFQCFIAGVMGAFVVFLSAKLAGALAGVNVQGAIQSMASRAGMSLGKPVAQKASGAGARAVNAADARVGSAAGTVGNQAAKNLKGGEAAASRKAAIQNMQRHNK